jgi:hypothetical protein
MKNNENKMNEDTTTINQWEAENRSEDNANDGTSSMMKEQPAASRETIHITS